MSKIKIHPGMAVIVPFYIFLGRGIEFFLVLMIVLLHEIAHIVTGRFFGLRYKEIMLTPIGVRAIIPNMAEISLYKRILVYLSGPLFNFISGFVMFFLSGDNPILNFMAYSSLYVGVFNLLPVLPLDAGNIFFQLFSKKYGALNSADIMKKIGRTISFLLIFVGVFQLILFGFNVSILLIGIFIYKNNDNE